MDEEKKKKKITQYMIRTYSLQILKEHVDCILDPKNMQPVDTENNQMNQMTEIKKNKK